MPTSSGIPWPPHPHPWTVPSPSSSAWPSRSSWLAFSSEQWLRTFLSCLTVGADTPTTCCFSYISRQIPCKFVDDDLRPAARAPSPVSCQGQSSCPSLGRRLGGVEGGTRPEDSALWYPSECRTPGEVPAVFSDLVWVVQRFLEELPLGWRKRGEEWQQEVGFLRGLPMRHREGLWTLKLQGNFMSMSGAEKDGGVTWAQDSPSGFLSVSSFHSFPQLPYQKRLAGVCWPQWVLGPGYVTDWSWVPEWLGSYKEAVTSMDRLGSKHPSQGKNPGTLEGTSSRAHTPTASLSLRPSLTSFLVYVSYLTFVICFHCWLMWCNEYFLWYPLHHPSSFLFSSPHTQYMDPSVWFALLVETVLYISNNKCTLNGFTQHCISKYGSHLYKRWTSIFLVMTLLILFSPLMRITGWKEYWGKSRKYEISGNLLGVNTSYGVCFLLEIDA